MSEDEKSLLVDELLELMKKSKLTKSQKISIMQIVDEQEKATENQRERFCLYYGLNVNDRKNMGFKQIAELYGCSYNAIRNSISSMRRKIINYSSDQEFLIIKKIVDDCKEGMENIAK